jgi:hypothetical protein
MLPARLLVARETGVVCPWHGSILEHEGALRGLLTLKDFLDEAEIAQVEAVLEQCAREADFN